MLASSWGDPVLGLDVHWEFIPMPGPVPTPVPNPFTGVVFDPMGLAIGLAISNAIGMALGGTFKGPVLYWGLPATNTGTEAKHVPGHILIPPGTGWAPVPKTPKPKIRKPPKPEKPVTPSNDAVVITGSKTVHVMGTNASRLGDLLLSCSEPVRLPSSAIIAVPKGPPILIGGPPALDLVAAAFASLRTRFIGDSLQAGISHLPIGDRGRAVLSWIACTLTGHPVDVATGKVMTRCLDAELPGPLPLRIDRFYLSNFAARRGPLGYGWSSSLDQAVWEERGKVVCLLDDGREVEFDTFDRPQHVMQVGDDLWHPIERLTLRRQAHGRWRLTAADGVSREYAPVAGAPDDGRARIVRIVSRGGFHAIEFTYGADGCLAWVRDSAGRRVGLEHDAQRRVTSLKLPSLHGRDGDVHRRFEYSPDGDLVRVTDAMGSSWHFEYISHLLTREMDRTGLSFYFAYDGIGKDAWCIRTWGDGGIYDHVLRYDKRNHVTFVANSTGHITQYRMTPSGLVTGIVDPLGAKVEFEYDPRSFQLTKSVDALGRSTRRTYDSRGNLIERSGPDGQVLTVEYDDRNLPLTATDSAGGRWSCSYDSAGLLTTMVGPSGQPTTLWWDGGMVVGVQRSNGPQVAIEYDDRKAVRRYREEGGVLVEYEYDAMGRFLASRADGRHLVSLQYDLEGNVVQVTGPDGQRQTAAFNAEGDLVEYRDATKHIRYRYGHKHRLEGTEQGGTSICYRYDTEDRLSAIVNEAEGEHRFEWDPAGRRIGETTVDGRRRRLTRDIAGRVVKIVEPSRRSTQLSYDGSDRVVKVEHSDGMVSEFDYRADGCLLEARNNDGAVRYELDQFGRVLAEEMGGERIESSYEAGPERIGMQSSLGARLGIVLANDGQPSELTLGALNQPGGVTPLLIERNHFGVEQRLTLAADLHVDWTLDRAGRPLNRHTRRHDGAAWQEVDSRAYAWRGLDQIVAIADSRGATEFDHDARGYAIREQKESVVVDRPADRAGNFYRLHDRSDRRYGPAGQLVWENGADFTYDADGFLLEKHEPGGRRWSYRWRGGMLREAEHSAGIRARFEYDPFARRTRKIVERRIGGSWLIEDEIRFIWDDHHLLHEDSRKHGLTTWYWKPDSFELVAREHGGRRWSVVTDSIGTVTEMYDDDGALVWQGSLNLHGESTVHVGSPALCPWRWPGGYYDAECDLIYLRHRYLTSAGVFISPDPLSALAGPRAYGYVADPLVQTDPLGLHTVYPKLNGQPVRNPRLGNKPFFPNVHGSGRAGPSPDGLGRLGDSENLLLRHLEEEHAAGRLNLTNSILEIESLRQGKWGAKPPCRMCGDALQEFATRYEMTIIYRETTGKGGLRTVLHDHVYRPNQPKEEAHKPGCGD